MQRLTASEAEKRRGMRRMKATASGFLAGATLLYVLAHWRQSHGDGWAGYLAAAAEAAMVGGLADWFAVTALFRRPLGLPIPHTAIIPHRKAALGHSLGEFVGENFLSAAVVQTRLRAVGLSVRLGSWLDDPAHAARVTREAAELFRAMLTVLRDEEVQDVLSRTVNQRLSAWRLGPPAGELLSRFAAQGGHRPLVDLLCRRAVAWLQEHPDSIRRAVTGTAPGWTPRFVDDRVADRVYRELLRLAIAVRDEPDHPARQAIDAFLADFANDLRSDPDTMAQAERLKDDLLHHPEVQNVVGSAWAALRSMIVKEAADSEGELRVRARDALMSFGARLGTDERLRAKVDGWVEGIAVYAVTTYRGEITALITDTVAGWDAEETSRKIEIQVGRDLQFIRINGTVVGALAGLVIYTISQLA
ncbi:MAG TPA: DUF445 domain-containing protein [Actinocrinis sp.]|nr:DUF445 domain-containing protein [Actinocrinis sp.]